MVTSKQRQRQIARASWERRQARRAAEAARRRKIRTAAGVVVGLVLTALLGWLVVSVVNSENARTPPPLTPPTDTGAPSASLPTPSESRQPTGTPTSGQSTGSTSTTAATSKLEPTTR